MALTLSGSDVETAAGSLTFAVGTGPANGTLSGTAPNLSYAPNVNFNGVDSFTFTVSDGTVNSTTATVSITVNAVNDAPFANAQAVTTNEDTAVAIVLAGSDVETAAGSLTFAVGTGPANGTLTGTAPNLSYAPNGNFNGVDSFTFAASDGTVNSTTATVSITVNAVNDAPVANAQAVTTNEDTAVAIVLAGSDVETVAGSLTFAVGTGPANGTLTGTAPNLSYAPNGNFNSVDSFTFTVNDGTVNSTTATVSITVNAVNDAPVANAQVVTTDEDTAVVIVLAGSDVETAAGVITFAIAGAPLNGTLTGTAPNLSYAPAEDFNGVDSFTFTVNDGAADSVPVVVELTIEPLNDAPALTVPDTQFFDEDTQVTFLAQDDNAIAVDDVDGDDVSVSLAVPAGTIILGNTIDVEVVAGADGTSAVTIAGTVVAVNDALEGLRFVPVADFHGEVVLTIEASDGTLLETAAVLLAVGTVNDVPVAVDDSAVAGINPILVDVIANDRDVDGDALSVIQIDSVSSGTAAIDAGAIRFTPARGFTGNATVVITVGDGQGGIDTSTLTIAVNGDRDDDGIPDVDDTCIDVAGPQTDTDADGLGDVCDDDDDGDAANDSGDNCVLAANADQLDTDGDDLGDVCDEDDDNDGVLDDVDICGLTEDTDQTNTDGDDFGDACDDDDDGDGVNDAGDTCVLVANADQLNVDADDLGNACDEDDDNDGVADLNDNCPVAANADQADADDDDVGDVCDDDRDGDGVDDVDDNCLLVENLGQADRDGDDIGDACDDDEDGDGDGNAADNCPTAQNPDQANLDNDAAGDACDDDDDGDGVLDEDDICPTAANAGQEDLDGDGRGDACDSDRDGDGIADDDDNCPQVDNADQVDVDVDGDGNACDDDEDGDGVANNVDNCPAAANADQADIDEDGLGDACDDADNREDEDLQLGGGGCTCEASGSDASGPLAGILLLAWRRRRRIDSNNGAVVALRHLA